MKIAIIDDDKNLNDNIRRRLSKSGYEADSFYYAKEFFQRKEPYILYIIDLSLGDEDGEDIVKYIRKTLRSNAPILIHSCHTHTNKKVLCLNLGADDYISKPVNSEELVARVKALLRRAPELELSQSDITCNGTTLNLISKKLSHKGKTVLLGTKETVIMRLLMRNNKKLTRRQTLINAVWGEDYGSYVSDNTINVTLSKLRKKLGGSSILETIVGEGYILHM